jgi:hypothetical protein
VFSRGRLMTASSNAVNGRLAEIQSNDYWHPWSRERRSKGRAFSSSETIRNLVHRLLSRVRSTN